MSENGCRIWIEDMDLTATTTAYGGLSHRSSGVPCYGPATFNYAEPRRGLGGIRPSEGGGALPVLSLEPVRPAYTTADLIDAYLETLAGRAFRDARSALKWARPVLGAIPLDRLSSYDLERLHAAIPPKRMANQVLDYLHAALRRAERWGRIPRGTNPAAYRGEYRHPERARKRILSASERPLMWAHLYAEEACGVEHRVLRSQGIQLLATTGLRKGEIIGLPWAEVTMHAQIPTVHIEHTKTGEPKTCYLAPEAVALLHRVDTEGMVFPWLTGRPLDIAWRELREACGFPDVVLHDVRRTYWSLVGEAGVPVEDACATSGHRSMRVHCEHYRHVSDERKAEIAAIGSSRMVN